jgi:invasion protein IalB
MALFRNFSPRKAGTAGGAILALLVTWSVALDRLTSDDTATAQTLAAKEATEPDVAQAKPATEQPKELDRPPAIWTVTCGDNAGKLDCRASQQVYIKTTGQRLLAVAVRVPPDTKKPVLMLQAPLGVYLPAGASVKIGKGVPIALPFKGCDRFGCVADYDLKDAELAAMLKGSDITISVQNQNKRPAFTITVPVTGFADAYAKIK